MGAHDALVKTLLDDPGVADALLRERLPAEVVALLGEAPAERLPDSFLDDELKESFLDRMFRVRTRAGDEAFVYCLVEHKRTPEPRVALQLARYLVRAFEWAAKAVEPPGLLPPVVALLLYNGGQRWNVPRRFSALVAHGAGLRGLLLDFEYAVLDLGAVPDADLSRHPRLKAGLLALKLATEGDGAAPVARIREVITELVRAGDLGVEALMPFLVYIHHVVGFDAVPLVREVVRATAPQKEQQMISAAEHYLQQGRVEGREEGREEGRVVALRGAVTSVLRKRFGALAPEVEAVLAAAGAQTLEQWLDRAIDAPTLDAVLH
jgi:predicted transposase YdaD